MYVLYYSVMMDGVWRRMKEKSRGGIGVLLSKITKWAPGVTSLSDGRIGIISTYAITTNLLDLWFNPSIFETCDRGSKNVYSTEINKWNYWSSWRYYISCGISIGVVKSIDEVYQLTLGSVVEKKVKIEHRTLGLEAVNLHLRLNS
jgi:hypothetical protein